MAFRHALFALLPLPRIYRRRVWHPCHTHAALSGGAAVSAAPTEHSCTNIVILTRNSQKLLGRRASHRFHRCTQMVRLRRVLPRNSRNSQKLLAEKSLPQMRTDAHRWLGCVGFSHGIHGIHRSFWCRRASHRCAQMVRLRRLQWEDSLVSAWVWQGCHTLLICAHPCNLW